MQELEILQNKETREQMINKVEVLDSVGQLLLLPNTEFSTTSQVANYFKVDNGTIENYYKLSKFENFKEELVSDGMKLEKYSNIIDLTGENSKTLLSNGFKIPTRGTYLFPKRAILRIGMIMRDNEIAKEIRTKLLDIEYESNNAIQENCKTIKENIIVEINEEKQLMLDRVEAEMNGDYPKVCEINSKLFALKNKRITDLETEIENITTHSLTLIESRNIINKLIRLIAIKEYSGIFGKAYGDLYKTVNYKLGINIKARDKKKNESYLDTLTEDEMFKVEEITRVWANDTGINIEKELSLAV